MLRAVGASLTATVLTVGLLVPPARDALIGVALRPLGSALVVTSSLPPRVDAVAVLGGGDGRGSREAPAAQLLKGGRAGVTVALGGKLPPTDPDQTYAGAVARRLRAQGVPPGAIVRVDEGASTAGELRALRRLA